MSDHHCWHFLRRPLGAAMTVMVLSQTLFAGLAFAAEVTGDAAQDSALDAAIAPVIARAVSSGDGTEDIVTTPAAENAAEGGDINPTDPENNNSGSQELYLDSTGGGALVDGFLLPEDEEPFEFIFTLKRNRETLTQAAVGIQKGFEYYLPLLEIGRAVRFKLDPDLEAERISGFFINEDNTFTLDNKAGIFTVRDETQEIPPDSVIVKKLELGLGDIYVTPQLLNRLWPLEVEYDQSELAAVIQTTLKLPRDLEIEREVRRLRLSGDEDDPYAGLELNKVYNGYRTLSLPVLNLSSRVLWREDREEGLRSINNLAGRNDILGTSANYSISTDTVQGDTPEVNNVRLRFTRRNLGNGELPWGLENLQFGDISTNPPDLIDNSMTGAGVVFTNSPSQRNTQFDRITVEGIAQAGWEVEIYNNNQLIDFGVVDERGEYRFEDVPLRLGRNTLKVVLYGPQGQVEERTQVRQINGNMIDPGRIQYQAAFLDLNSDFIRVDDDNELLPRGGASQFFAGYGLSNRLTPFITYTDTPTREGPREYITAGVNFSALGGFGKVEAYDDRQAGSALDLRYANRFAGIRYNLRTSFLNDFESEEAGFDERARTFESEVSLNTNLKTPIAPVALGLEHEYEVFEDETSQAVIRTNFNTSFAGVRLNNRTTTNIDNGSHNFSTGSTNLETRFSSAWRARTNIDYDIWPTVNVDDASLDITYRSPKDKRFTASLELGQRIDQDESRFRTNLSYDFGTFLGGLDFGWDEQRGLNIGLRANTSLAPFGANNTYIASSENLVNSSNYRGRVFLDKNYNYRFDGDDEPLPKSKVFIGNRKTKGEDINEEGIYGFNQSGLPTEEVIRVDGESLPDPFMLPAIDGYLTQIRPVAPNPPFNFPIILSGIIDGIAYFADGDPIPGLKVQLLDESGRMIDETATAFDGFYLFEFVRPGRYTVRVAPSHQINVPAQPVEVTPTELFASGIDLRVLEQAQGVPADAETDEESGRVAQTYHAPSAGGTLTPAPYPSDGGFQATVRSVRIGEHPSKVRLVLDLSAPADYKISSEDDGHVINIDLPSTAWDADRNKNFAKDSIFESFEVTGLDGGSGSRLRLKASKPVEIFYNSKLPADAGKPPRIYADFIKAR